MTDEKIEQNIFLSQIPDSSLRWDKNSNTEQTIQITF